MKNDRKIILKRTFFLLNSDLKNLLEYFVKFRNTIFMTVSRKIKTMQIDSNINIYICSSPYNAGEY